MAQRPIFCPNHAEPSQPLVKRMMIDFKWHPGMSATQKRKNIAALHTSAAARGISPVLEVSTKSEDDLGWRLSAFNLQVLVDGMGQTSLEAAFQGSKVFAGGGPYQDIYRKDAMQAKKDPRLRQSGELIAFDFNGRRWPLTPLTAFYDWLYLHALQRVPAIYEQLKDYRGFSDIEFNPKKSINCQAGACALFVSLGHAGKLEPAMRNPQAFLEMMRQETTDSANGFRQASLL